MKIYLNLLYQLTKRNIFWIYLILFKKNVTVSLKNSNMSMFLKFDGLGLDIKEKNIYKQLALDRVRENYSTDIIRRLIEPDDVILELGANIGYYVLVESDLLSKKGYIYAVEPDKSNIDNLKKNIELNHVSKRVKIYNLALSDKNGKATIFHAKEANLHTLLKPNGSNYTKSSIKTNTVDQFLKGKRPVTFIRMDIEGYEYFVIKGIKQTFRNKNLKKLFIEIHTHKIGEEKVIEILKILKKHGFEVHALIFRDKAIRRLLDQTEIRRDTIDSMIEERIFATMADGFQAFFVRK